MGKIHSFKDNKLHIYVRTDRYNGKLRSKNWVGRTFIQSKQTIKSSGTSNFTKAKDILFKWYDELQFKKKHNIEVHKRDWLERELDKHNHKLELVRTILPIILLVMQTIIMIKIF